MHPELVRTDRGPFGLPRGLTGRLAGRMMASKPDQQSELAKVVELPEHGNVCEVGFGPGVLLGLLRIRFPRATFAGIDPSTVMLRQATRANGLSSGVAAAPDLRVAAAGDLPFADKAFDLTIAVNNSPFWPDLTAGLAEMRRVTRVGGVVMVAWHGGAKPSRIQRRLLLKPAELTALSSAMIDQFDQVEHKSLMCSELFIGKVLPTDTSTSSASDRRTGS